MQIRPKLTSHCIVKIATTLTLRYDEISSINTLVLSQINCHLFVISITLTGWVKWKCNTNFGSQEISIPNSNFLFINENIVVEYWEKVNPNWTRISDLVKLQTRNSKNLLKWTPISEHIKMQKDLSIYSLFRWVWRPYRGISFLSFRYKIFTTNLNIFLAKIKE